VTSSIGIAVYPDDSDDPEELLKHADVAMYRSKDLGRNTYQFLDANLAEHRLKQHTLETALRGALKDNVLRLHYQPVVRITDKAIVGAEALLRWTDPEHGIVPPQVFVPLAEESGLIHALGEWVLRTAAAQCVAVAQGGPAADHLGQPVGQAVLPRGPRAAHLGHRARRRLRAVVDRARGHRDEPAARPRRDPQGAAPAARRRLHRRDRRLRHRLLVADPPQALPDRHAEDRHLVHRRPRDRPGDAAITEAIIGLARGLGLKVVAEGVGTREQLEFLDVRGCHCFQGYWASKPLAADAFLEFVTRKAH
jgi:EAL domain-containing protein (putative c-di-GMP-specific phosphodiesterase class I)